MTNEEVTSVAKKIWRYSIADCMFVGIVIASNKAEAVKKIRQYYTNKDYSWRVKDIKIRSITESADYGYGVLETA